MTIETVDQPHRPSRGRSRGMTKLIAVVGAAAVLAGVLPAAADASNGRSDPGIPELRDVRSANARFASIGNAEAAGFSGDIVPQCMDQPGVGGMGVHWINLELLTDGHIIPDRPEALVYGLNPEGHKVLVAVEWVMPPDATYPPPAADGSGPRPSLFGQDFTWHPTLGVWKLHAWLYTPNPNGMFADYNPAVALCPT